MVGGVQYEVCCPTDRPELRHEFHQDQEIECPGSDLDVAYNGDTYCYYCSPKEIGSSSSSSGCVMRSAFVGGISYPICCPPEKPDLAFEFHQNQQVDCPGSDLDVFYKYDTYCYFCQPAPSSSSSCPYPAVPNCLCGYGVSFDSHGCLVIYCPDCPGDGTGSGYGGGSNGGSGNPQCAYPTIPSCRCGLVASLDSGGCVAIDCATCPSSSSSGISGVQAIRHFCVTDKQPGSSSSSEPASVQPLFDKESWSGAIPSPYAEYLNQAADRWAQHAKFDPAVFSAIQQIIPGWNGIRLEPDSYSQTNDSQSQTIASCGPTQGVDLTGDSARFNSTHFSVSINTYYESQFNSNDWVDVLTHELGHALGIGIFWDPAVTSITGGTAPSNYFLDGTVYANAQGAYNSITSLGRQEMPLEDTGGSGTASSHWDDNYRPSTAPGSLGVDYFGFHNELMVGYFSPGLGFVLSELSIKTLVDFGYQAVGSGMGEGVPDLVTGVGAMGEGMIKLDCAAPREIKITRLDISALSAAASPCPRCIPEYQYDPTTLDILATFNDASSCELNCGCGGQSSSSSQGVAPGSEPDGSSSSSDFVSVQTESGDILMSEESKTIRIE